MSRRNRDRRFTGKRSAAAPTAGAPSCAAVVFLGVASTVTSTVANATAAELFVNGSSAGAMTVSGSTATIAWTPATDDETTELVVRATGPGGTVDSATTTVDAQDWLEVWDADYGLVAAAGDLVTWTGRRNGNIWIPGAAAPAVVATFAGRAAAAVQFVVASSEYATCNAIADDLAQGDDTPFTIVTQATIDSPSSGEVLWSLGYSGAATDHIRLSCTGATTMAPVGRGNGNASNVTGSPAVTIAAATEYTIRYARTATAVRIGLGTTYVDSAFDIGALATIDRFALGCLLRSAASAYCDQTVRRMFVRAGTPYSDARHTALRNLIHGT